MAVNQRPPGHHVVDEAVAVHVLDGGAGRPLDEQRNAADGLEGADRAVDAAGKNLPGLLEELAAANGLFHADRSVRAASRA